MADIADPYLRAHSMLTLLQALPDVNRNTLLFLLHHLRRYTTSFQLVTVKTLISFHPWLTWITFGIDGCKSVFNCPSPSRTSSLFLCFSVCRKEEENKMSLSNLATVFGPSLLRPPVARVDISQEVAVQVSWCLMCPVWYCVVINGSVIIFPYILATYTHMQFSLLGFVLEEVKQHFSALNRYLSIFSTVVWTYEMCVYCLFV